MISEETRMRLCRRAFQAQPFEVCGFVLRDETVIEIPNVHHDPHRGFLMSRAHLLERVPNPVEIQAIWHSHPKGSLRPSKADIDSMFQGAISKDWDYLIVTASDIATIDPKTFVRQEDSFWNAFSTP